MQVNPCVDVVSLEDIPYNITTQDIYELAKNTDTCDVFGVRLVYYGRGTTKSDSASQDKIDPKRGYVHGNVRIISHRGNMLKSNMALTECRQLLTDLEEIEKHKT